MKRTLCIAMIMALPLPPGILQAQESTTSSTGTGALGGTRQVVIYRCTDAAGRVTIQNDVACPKGTTQQRQVVDAPTPMPADVAREERMPEVVAAGHAAEADGIVAGAGADATRPAGNTATPAERGPPPALYACKTWDARAFFTEDATPAERCAPLPVVSLDGSVRGDATACEQVADTCEAVPADALCRAWRQRVDEAEFRWKFAGAQQDDARRREFESLEATLARNDCAR